MVIIFISSKKYFFLSFIHHLYYLSNLSLLSWVYCGSSRIRQCGGIENSGSTGGKEVGLGERDLYQGSSRDHWQHYHSHREHHCDEKVLGEYGMGVKELYSLIIRMLVELSNTLSFTEYREFDNKFKSVCLFMAHTLICSIFNLFQ